MLVRAFDAGRPAEGVDASSAGAPVFVALHARGGDAASGIALARSLAGDAARIVALQAARPCNPMQSNLRDAAAYAGFSWYLGADAGRPEPASFGDALRQIDLFVEELDRPFVLVGAGQGAVLAFAYALLAPRHLRAVMLDGEAAPALEGWNPPARALDGVRFVARGLGIEARRRAQELLAARGAVLETSECPGTMTSEAARRSATSVAAWISALVAAVPLALAATVALWPSPALAASAGAQPATTGVPAVGAQAAEATCTACHNSSALNPDAGGTISLEGAPAKYEPGKVYRMTLRIAHTDATVLRWGFQLTAIAMKDGEGAGELVASDVARTLLLPVASGTRAYLSHGYNGTDIGTTGGTAWSFDWKAPAQPVGKVGFFACANAANADGSNQGDRIYSKSPAPIAESDAP